MCYKCQCSIVPENILTKLAEQGNEGSRIALNDLPSLQNRRNSILSTLQSRSAAITQTTDRYVYDAKNTHFLRNTLIRKENEPVTGDSAADDIYEISGYVRDYFKNTFQYDLIDNNGMDIILNVHYRTNYNNAFWDGDEMAFGDGDGNTFTSFASSKDVVAHELMHGITQFIANLQYYGQPGALNEHYSDVFGTICKQKMQNESVQQADWLIGNDVVGPHFNGVAIRSMKAPGTAYQGDPQPDHMNNYYSGSDDNQGVHINSGIPNKAFYLASLDFGSVDETALIWFETLKKLTPTSDFNHFATVLKNETNNLSSIGKIPVNSISKISDALYKVGL